MNAPASTAARDPDLRSALTALNRAAKLARQEAIQTDTDLVVVKDGKIVLIEAKTLREQTQANNGSPNDRRPN